MYSVLAGFSAFKNRAKSLSIVSLTLRLGYLSLFSETSLKPLVTIEPRAYSMKVVESSLLRRVKRFTGSSVGGIFTGNSALLYLAGVHINF
jgi:hypothetical protein